MVEVDSFPRALGAEGSYRLGLKLSTEIVKTFGVILRERPDKMGDF